MAKIKKIYTEFGISQAKGPNNWIKATAGMEIELENGDESNKEAMWEGSWERVIEEVGKQLKKLDETPQ